MTILRSKVYIPIDFINDYPAVGLGLILNTISPPPTPLSFWGFSALGHGLSPHSHSRATQPQLRVPEELWTEVCDIVQEEGSRPSAKKKKCKKARWLSEEALQIAVKRREVKGKGEKETYTHLNAEFQRIARRYKKAFLSDQCKEIEENSRRGKTKDLFSHSSSW